MARYSIPDKLVAVSRSKVVFKQSYTDKEIECRPAFIADASVPTMVQRAESWARGDSYRDLGDPQVEEIDNDPLHALEILCIEHRGEGGIAYKVVTEQGYLVDLREKEFLEALFMGWVQDGVIRGEYVWSKGGTQMRLVRVGSQMYEDRLREGQRGALRKIRPKDLVVGNLYATRSEEKAVYLGRARHSSQGRKLLFVWAPLNEHTGNLYAWGRILQDHEYVEDLGPAPHNGDDITLFSGPRDTELGRSSLEWVR